MPQQVRLDEDDAVGLARVYIDAIYIVFYSLSFGGGGAEDFEVVPGTTMARGGGGEIGTSE